MQLLSPEAMDRRPPVDWLIPGILPANELAMFYGASGSGKTFCALHMAACVVAGMAFNGVPVVSGRVVYVAGEGESEFAIRRQAWEAHHQRKLAENLFFLVPEPVQLGRSKSVEEFLELLLERERVLPDLIVIDTLSSCSLGVDENDNGQMRDMLQGGADRIRRATHATVLLIHHTGKDAQTQGSKGTARGAQTLMDSMAMQARLTRAGDSQMALTCTKLKDGKPFAPIALTLREMTLPDGRTSLAAACADDGTAAAQTHQAQATTKNGKAYKTGPRQRTRRLSQSEVLRVVRQHGAAGIGPTDIAKALGVDPRGSSVKNLLRKLLEGGQVRRVGEGNAVKYVATTDATNVA